MVTTGRILLSFFIVLAMGLPALIPVFRIPKPTGPYSVGTITVQITDPARAELITHDTDDLREVLLHIWYPGVADRSSVRAPYWQNPALVSKLIAEQNDFPSFFFQHISRLKTHAFLNIPICDQVNSCPVLLYSHGYGQIPEENTALTEELASHGYVVVSVGHPYESVVLFFPDGRTVQYDKYRFQKVKEELQHQVPLWEQIQKKQSRQGKIELFIKMKEQSTQIQKFIDIRTQDIHFVIDEINRGSDSDIPVSLSKKMDCNRIGMFGMSLGGETCARVCFEDHRIRAGVNLDGINTPEFHKQRIPQPFMIMRSGTLPFMEQYPYSQFDAVLYHLFVRDSKHLDFTDFSLISPIASLMGLTGSINGQRMMQIKRNFVVSFFNMHLLDRKSSVFKQTDAQYPEVELTLFSHR